MSEHMLPFYTKLREIKVVNDALKEALPTLYV
jgi:hypothetical protein